MIKKYTVEEFNNAKSKDNLLLECEHCHKLFYAYKALIVNAINYNKSKCKFCSQECYHNSVKVGKVKVICEFCNSEKYISLKEYNRSITKKFFCTRAESNLYFNKLKKHSYIDKVSDAKFIEIINESSTISEVYKKLGYKANGRKSKIINRCKELGLNYNKFIFSLCVLTKQELYSRRSSWQSYRSTVRKYAVEMYKNSGLPMSCAICGYDKYVEIAHIKAVHTFDSIIPLSTISNIDNLIALCPNHHYEYDNGLIAKETILELRKNL